MSSSSKSVDTAAAAATLAAMKAIFAPKSIAVVGATERAGSVGMTVVKNLQDSLKTVKTKTFELYPVNPTRPEVLGLKCYGKVSACPTPVDMTVIITPPSTVVGCVEDAGKSGCKVCVIITAGFKEVGEKGLELENAVVAMAKKHNVRIIGPNCLGVMSPSHGMNATFAAANAMLGSTAFISQSGAMCTAVLDWSFQANVGFSAFVSIGSMSDVEWSDLITYLGNDEATKTILIYMETIGNSEAFLRSAAEVATKKPIIVIKAGQTEAAAKAAASHTGSLAGSHDSFVAAMRRAGVMVVNTINELCDAAMFLGKQPKPTGGNLLIITNAGGPGVLSTDAATLSGATVCNMEDKTIKELDSFLPPAWSHGNPLDILGDASAALYARTLEVALADKVADGVLVVLSPQSVTDSTGTAKTIVEAYNKLKSANKATKPIICSWMGGKEVQEGFGLLTSNGIPCYSYPDTAARMFGTLWKHEEAMKEAKPSVPLPASADAMKSRECAMKIISKARGEKRELLTEAESKQILRMFNIPVAETIICADLAAAEKAVPQVNFPCVMKLHSETITHKSDVGGVKLNLKSVDDVKKAYKEIKENIDKIGSQHFQGVTLQPMVDLTNGIELILGSVEDPQFGNLVLFGTGGVMVEIFKDSALGLPPLTSDFAAQQIRSCKIFKALEGAGNQRFPGVDVKAIENVLVQFSQLIKALGDELSECDVNPLLATPKKIIALDGRMVLKKRE